MGRRPASLDTLRAAQARGCEWLDLVYPEWWARVAIGDLDLGSNHHCLLSQLFTTDTDYPGWLALQDVAAAAGMDVDAYWDWLEQHGFDAITGHPAEYGTLTELWERSIKARWGLHVPAVRYLLKCEQAGYSRPPTPALVDDLAARLERMVTEITSAGTHEDRVRVVRRLALELRTSTYTADSWAEAEPADGLQPGEWRCEECGRVNSGRFEVCHGGADDCRGLHPDVKAAL